MLRVRTLTPRNLQRTDIRKSKHSTNANEPTVDREESRPNDLRVLLILIGNFYFYFLFFNFLIFFLNYN